MWDIEWSSGKRVDTYQNTSNNYYTSQKNKVMDWMSFRSKKMMTEALLADAWKDSHHRVWEWKKAVEYSDGVSTAHALSDHSWSIINDSN